MKAMASKAKKMGNIIKALAEVDCEVFPKQDGVAGDGFGTELVAG